MSEAQPVRSVKRRRLVAACTTGILSLGALALGTTAQAADGPQHTIDRVTAPSTAQHQLDIPKSRMVQKAAVAPALRYDADGDGYNDLLYRGSNAHYYSFTTTENDLGATGGTLYKDVILPGDLNGVAGPEVLGLSASGQLSLFTGSSFPNYPSWSGSGWNIYNKLVATNDVTGDGKPDLVARTPDGALYLYPGTGSGSAPFAARVLVGSGWGQFDQLVGADDVDGDGRSDLLARSTSGSLYLYKGTGNASSPFAARVLVGGGWNTFAQLISMGDMTGDGVGDVLALTSTGRLSIYAGDPTVSTVFKPRAYVGANWNLALWANAGGNPAYGKGELFGMTSGGTLYWYYTHNDGTFSARQQVGNTGGFKGSALVFASSLGDYGYPDLLERYATGLYNLGLDSASPIATGWGGYNLMAGPGDLSGDGKGDMLARDTSGLLYLFRGQGTGYSLTARILVGSGWNAYNAIVGAGDFSGDGRADIVARAGNGTLYLYKGTGNSSRPFSSRVTIGTGWGQYNKLASAGDIDGDGRADLLAVDSAGTLYRYSAYGTGQFKSRVSLGSGWNSYGSLL